MGGQKMDDEEKAPVPGDTKFGLILAAEKVFSIYGFRGATFRQIREEAGQKNESVVHYHFGSKEAIIRAVMGLRTRPINQARAAMLRENRESNEGRELSTEQIMRCCIMPFSDYLLMSGETGYYARFLTQMRSDRASWMQFRGYHDDALIDCLNALKRTRPHIPPSIINQRFIAAMFAYVSSVAVMEENKSENPDGFQVLGALIRIEELVTTSVAIMDTGLSAGVMDAIDRAGERSCRAGYRTVSLRSDAS